MSINELASELEVAAWSALQKAGAIKACNFHPDVTIRLGDDDAERKAYAIATNTLKRDGTIWLRAELMPAIKQQLDMAADGECPACAELRDS